MKFMGTAYVKEMHRQLRVAAKGSGWKPARGVVFRQVEQWFIAGHCKTVSADPGDGLRIEILAKPMALDPMLWDAMGLQENRRQPLSFRYWGAFICGTPVLKTQVIHEVDPAKAMPLMLEVLDGLLPDVMVLLETRKFSELAKAPAGIHDNWRMQETIIHALRLERNPELALASAEGTDGAFLVAPTDGNAMGLGTSHNALVADVIRDEIRQPFLKRMRDRIFKT